MKQLFLVITVILITCGWVAAQENKTDSSEPPSDSLKYHIVVTATRTEQPTLELGSTTTLITAEELKQSGKNTLIEALASVPGLDVVQSGGPGNTASVFIRGANTEHSLVMIDGVEVNDPISPGRTFNFGNLTLDNIDRVEIVRGPQSTLYGSDAMGGVINIITKKGQGKPGFFVSAEAGSYNTFREAAGLSGKTGILDYAIGLSRFDTKGFSASAAKYGNTEKDGYANTTFSSRLGINPKPGMEFNFISRFTDAKSELDNFEGPGGDDPNYTLNAKLFLLAANSRMLLLNGKWEQKLNISYNRVHRDLDNDIDELNPFDSSSGRYTGRSFKVDWQHNIYLLPGNTVTAGIEYERESGDSIYRWDSLWGPGESLFPKKSARTTGFYLQDSVKIGEFLFVNLGLRLDDHNRFGSETTYRIAPAVVLNSGTKIRATYGTGFKAPSLYQLYAPATDWGPLGNQALEPEKSKAWDIGLEQFLFNDRLSVSFTYFKNKFQDLIEYDWMQGYTNIAVAETKGMEVFAFAHPLAHLTLTASYTYTKALNKITNEYLLRRPKHKANLAVNYRLLDKADLHLDMIYVGEREDIFPYPTRTIAPAYTLFNFAANLQVSRNFELFGRIDNLLDKDYEAALGYGSPRRSAYIGIRANY